ncbi:hypothetical protein ACFL20_13905, partial [Spirochaetota bacterium]
GAIEIDENVGNSYRNIPDDIYKSNKDIFGTGMALANPLGYPNGKAILKPFPVLELGWAIGGSVHKYERIKGFDIDDDPASMGFGANMGFHIGTGLTDRLDVTIKFFFMNVGWFYKIPTTYSFSGNKFKTKMNDVFTYSFGLKARYNIVKKIKILKYVFDFGGVTAGLGLDYMNNKFNMKIKYDNDDDLLFTIRDPGDVLPPYTSEDQNLSIHSTGTGAVVMNGNIISVTPEIFAYADIFHVLSFYTGPSVSFNAGFVEFKTNATGVMTNNEQVYYDPLGAAVPIVGPGNKVADAVMESRYKFYPQWAIPRWVLGLQINIMTFKIHLEAAVDLSSITDSFTAQFGFSGEI